MDSREEWFDLISEHEMAVDLFKQYYEETEYYDLLNEYNLHVSDFKSVFYQLLRNAVYNVDTLQQENSPFELDEGEKVEARIFDLQKCCDMLIPGVNDFDVTVGWLANISIYTLSLHHLTILLFPFPLIILSFSLHLL